VARQTAEDIYEAIKQQILSGDLRPAERLIEANLAKSLNASRHHIRAALDRLHIDGLVEIEANKGARVSSLTLEEVVDLYVAREGMEAEVVRLAVKRITDAEISELGDCLQEMAVAFESGQFDEYSKLNQRFHGIIFSASGNETLPEYIAQIRLRLARLNVRVILLPGRSDSSHQEHTAIYEALGDRHTERAIEAIRRHISGVRQDIEKGWAIVGM